jgi:hypothetical protein
VWDGAETPPDPQLVSLALKVAEDPACGVDVRVTALQTGGEQALPVARRLANDKTQPISLRKVAIGCIGQYGGDADKPQLESVQGENFRLAQAAEPALRAIARRSSNPPSSQPIPF